MATWEAEAQLESLISEVEYLMSYWVAVPDVPSFPGAVQLRVIESLVMFEALRFVIWEGRLESVEASVLAEITLERGETFPASSVVLIAK